MIKIEITAGSYAEAATLMAALAASGMQIKGGAQLSVGAAPVEVAKDPAKSAAVTKPAPAERPAQAAAAPAKAPEAEAPGVTYLDVKKAAGDMAKDPAKRPVLVAILAKYGAKTGADLTPGQWAPVIADLAEAAGA
jgi:hypothetical protein